MMTNRRNNYIFAFILFLLSILAIFILSYEIASFDGPPWFYHPISDAKKAIAHIPKLAVLSYFTYLSMLCFGVWGLGYFVAAFSDLPIFKKFFFNNYVILTVTVFGLITCLLYTVSQVFSPIPFGFEGTEKKQIVSFVFGLCMHYLFPITVLWHYFFINTPQKLNFKRSLYITLIFIVYAAVVKFVGKFCYNVEWYPYAVFTPTGLWQVLPFTFEYNSVLITVIECAIAVGFVGGIVLAIYALVKYSNVKEKAFKEKQTNLKRKKRLKSRRVN